MEARQNKKLIICLTALNETQTVLTHRINAIMVAIIEFLPRFFQPRKMSLLESQILLIEIFKELRTQKPESANFLNLVYEEISNFIQNEEIIHLNFKNLSNVKQSIKDIYFKNTYDERIFQTLMTNLNEIQPIEFFSDDREFIEKSEMGYAKISVDLKYGTNAFFPKLLPIIPNLKDNK